jgi:hypothetical protein
MRDQDPYTLMLACARGRRLCKTRHADGTVHDFDAVKRLDPDATPRKPPLRKASRSRRGGSTSRPVAPTAEIPASADAAMAAAGGAGRLVAFAEAPSAIPTSNPLPVT